MELAVEIGNVGSPQLLGSGTLLLDPLRYPREHIAAALPLVQIVRATNGKFACTLRAVIRAKHIPGIAVLGDRRIVGVLDIAIDLQDNGLLFRRGGARSKQQPEQEGGNQRAIHGFSSSEERERTLS